MEGFLELWLKTRHTQLHWICDNLFLGAFQLARLSDIFVPLAPWTTHHPPAVVTFNIPFTKVISH
jgi:hypothetical protein